jgi:hypothetical protein
MKPILEKIDPKLKKQFELAVSDVDDIFDVVYEKLNKGNE